MSTGRKMWIWTALVISALILLLLVGGLAGTWVVRNVLDDIVTAGLTAVHDVAGVGREQTAKINGFVGELRGKIGEVEVAVGQVAQNVQDQGLIVTLLPPEKEQELQDVADRITEAVDSIAGVVEAAVGVWDALDSIPFIDMPQLEPERAARLEAGVGEIATSVDQLATDIQAFRDGSAETIGTVAQAANQVNTRLGTTENNLTALDAELANVQTRAMALIDLFRLVATITALVTTLILAWLIYALIILMRRYWGEWQSRTTSGKPAKA